MKVESPIETPRLLLRAYRAEDRVFCLSLWCDAQNGAYMSDPESRNIDERYLSYFDDMENDPDGYYLIAVLRDGLEPVGTCCLFPEGENADIGYCIRRDHWREGLGRELLEGLLQRIKANGFRSVTAEVADENAASKGLLQSFGFVPAQATCFKKYGTDVVFDAHVYRLKIE